MDFENYLRHIRSVNEQLQNIAEQTARQAWLKCADSTNPMFVSAMAEHKRLTDLSEKLTNQMSPVAPE